MKKILIIIGIIVALPIGYWLISPLFIERRVSEELPATIPPQPAATAPAPTQEPSQPEIVAAGTFVGLKGHNAQGTAKLLKVGDDYYVRFEDDFRVTNGPDLFVYLGKDGKYDPSARLERLKGNVGSQNYPIPSSIKVSRYNEVWVWCRAFSVAFGKATLK